MKKVDDFFKNLFDQIDHIFVENLNKHFERWKNDKKKFDNRNFAIQKFAFIDFETINTIEITN